MTLLTCFWAQVFVEENSDSFGICIAKIHLSSPKKDHPNAVFFSGQLAAVAPLLSISIISGIDSGQFTTVKNHEASNQKPVVRL